MPKGTRFTYLFTIISGILFSQYAYSQVAITDTSAKTIQIIGAKSFRQQKNDTATLIMLAGDARVRQGNTFLSGDSIVLNQESGIAEVFGHVHINDADTVNTYADYLKYLGNSKMAYLKNNVKLTDGKATLFTDDLDYNIQTGIANYQKGGKVINGKTTLTSTSATYYSDTKDVYFKQAVNLRDPKYDIRADSLLYNTALQTASFISPTRIKTTDGTINTSSGTYNLKTGEAIFLNRTSFSDSTRFMSGDRIATDEKSGVVQIEGRGKLVDSSNNVTVIGDMILLDRKKNSFLATRKPVMIIYRGNDSTYISADTLFSGLRKFDSTQHHAVPDLKKANSTKGEENTPGETEMGNLSLNIIPSPEKKDSSLSRENKPIIVPSEKDSAKQQIAQYPSADSTVESGIGKANTLKDSLNTPQTVNLANDSIRYFIAFHHVRIFNDSLQAVSDSLHYSTEDSVFKLFTNPIVWNGKNQLTGDTMYLFTKNQKPERIYVFFNGLMINNPEPQIFNQITGRTINGYFKDGVIDYARVKGSPAESIYYPQDEDSAYIGMNRSKSDVIDIYFSDRQLNKVKFVNDVNGTMYPLRQIPPEQKTLRGFLWQDNRRPKNKLELFE